MARPLLCITPCDRHDTVVSLSVNNACLTMTFASFAPKLKIGCLQPGAIIDNAPYEFYRLAPPGVMLVMVGVGLKEFSSQDVERVFAPLDRYLDQLMDRGVDLVIQNGVAPPLPLGLAAHERQGGAIGGGNRPTAPPTMA